MPELFASALPGGATATFSDRAAREMLLLRAYESLNDDDTQDDHPLWTRADALWATKVASETAGPSGTPKAFFEARAHAAMQRLSPRDDGVRRALSLRGWRWSLLPIAALAAFLLGALAYDIGTNQRIDLLSLPVWIVVLWNLAVYVGLALAWLRRLGQGKTASFGGLRKFIGRRFAARVSASPRKAPALASFGKAWAELSWPIAVARAGSVLHIGAAALALGLVGGMYLRGLVLDYRAGWQSTFLEPRQVTSFLSTVLQPASTVTSVALPDEAAVTALRLMPDQAATGEAASWIHLYAATLAIFVIVPRLLLALGSVLRAAWLSRKLPVAIDEPYHQRLLQQHRQQHGGSGSRVRAHPHGAEPRASAALALRKLIARVLGEATELEFAPAVSYGREDSTAALPAPAGAGASSPGTGAVTPWGAPPSASSSASSSASPNASPSASSSASSVGPPAVEIALFDASATPEMEAQGRFVESLRARVARASAMVMVVDEASFAARFGAAGERVEQRRTAWRELADKLAMPPPVFVDLDAPVGADQARALDAALVQVNARALPAA